MEPDYQEFLLALGKRIKQLRRERGWSLRDMVIQHGYHDSQWRKYESGGGVTLASLLRIATLFGVSISKLLEGIEEFSPRSVEETKGSSTEPARRRGKTR